ncbi:MAG: HigA family addiction module antidote protein [Tyzzerella sp.]|nr:HigA family addiction module antidote protein [Tyzzerella sp.]
MSNYIEYKDTIAFHPGYYIKEIIEDSGLTQEDFAKRLDTTPKNLSYLVRGEQSLSIDIAMKLSRMLGVSVSYWLNLQKTYDSLVAEFKSDEELASEKKTFEYIDYHYFRDNFGLPDLPRKVDEQIKCVREFLNVATLNVLKDKNLAVSFRSASDDLSVSNIVNANAMVQIAINSALKINAPKYDKKKFLEAVEYALTLTTRHNEFFPLIRKAFLDAGVIFVILPNLKNSGINGATKKVGSNVMLMVNDRRAYSDTFWFTLFHEIGHIINGDYGITFSHQVKGKEDAADLYAQNALIPTEEYEKFVMKGKFDEQSIRLFANEIERDPGIVLGRLQNDGKVTFNNSELSKALKHKYKVKVV